MIQWREREKWRDEEVDSSGSDWLANSGFQFLTPGWTAVSGFKDTPFTAPSSRYFA